MIAISVLFVVGLFLSAFFSGTETGFYRVSRIRLLLDGLGGDPRAKGLLWLTNNPTLFVATTLIGNNMANYLVSLAIVLAAGLIVQENSFFVQMAAPIVFAPLVFVYGELLPKSLFFYMPNRLLYRSALLFILFGILLAPGAAILWIFGRLLHHIIGESPARVQLMLARKELVQVLEEGHHAGILQPAQRKLAQGLFAVANQPVVTFATPAARVPSVRLGTRVSDVLRMARRHGVPAIPVVPATGSRQPVGYVRVVDLFLSKADRVEEVHPLLDIRDTDRHIEALMRMQTEQEMLARVVNEEHQTVGLISARRLIEPLFRGE